MKKLWTAIAVLCCAAVVLTACTNGAGNVNNAVDSAVNSAQESQNTADSEQKNSENLSKAELILQDMTLRQKVGQMFFVRPDCFDTTQTKQQIVDPYAQGVTTLNEDMASVLENWPVGGVMVFSKNIETPQQLAQFNSSLQQSSEIPLFISVDEEGGAVARIANHPAFEVKKYENAAAVGKTEDTAKALEMGQTIGKYLKDYGFNMDFAPVADVNTNPGNPIIGSRAFSSDPLTAAKMAQAMAQGLKNEGIIPTYKHFPGHGDTAEDSHNGIAVSNKTQGEMENCEWLTFKSASESDLIMVGHIAVPQITGDMVPSTLSYTVVTDILKNKIGFGGLVVTDSMEMGAVTESYTGPQAAVMAINAGCDIILGPDGFTETFDAVVQAVENGEISQSRIDESVRKILEFKISYGIIG